MIHGAKATTVVHCVVNDGEDLEHLVQAVPVHEFMFASGRFTGIVDSDVMGWLIPTPTESDGPKVIRNSDGPVQVREVPQPQQPTAREASSE